MQHQSTALAYLAFTLSTLVEGERAKYCQAWAAYWGGTGKRPGKLDVSGGEPANRVKPTEETLAFVRETVVNNHGFWPNIQEVRYMAEIN